MPSRERREKRRLAGKCGTCGRELDEDRLMRNVNRCLTCNQNDVKRSRAKKIKLIEHCGGCCADCGLVSEYPEVYDFHHLDSSKKEFEISLLTGHFTLAKCLEEVEKCVMLCANCHRIRHAKEKLSESIVCGSQS